MTLTAIQRLALTSKNLTEPERRKMMLALDELEEVGRYLDDDGRKTLTDVFTNVFDIFERALSDRLLEIHSSFSDREHGHGVA